jgi:hypothetical protein
MKLFVPIACALAISAPSLATAAGENYGCESINFSQEVLTQMPNAKKLCRGIKEKNGGVYVHYVAKVESVSPTSVTVSFLDKDDKAVSRITFEPSADQTMMLDKKATKYTDLTKGQKVDFWVEHSKWGLFATPDSPMMKITKVERF